MMTELLRSLAPAWANFESAFPLIGLLIAIHIALPVLLVVSRAAGLGPRAWPWGYMRGIAAAIDTTNRSAGRLVAWLAILMVAVQFTIIVLSYVFSTGYIWLTESVLYMHGTLFLVAAAYTLLEDGHVRVDIFYRGASAFQRRLTDFLGAYLFLMPLMGLILWVSYPYVARSWAFFEGSRETSGIQGVFLLKSLIILFAVMMFLQGLSIAIRRGHALVGGEEQDRSEQPRETL